MKLKMIMGTALTDCSITASGWGAGIASATPISPVTPVTTWAQGPGHGHGHGGDDWDGDWGGPWYGPGWYGGAPGINACVSATGPWGYVSGRVCI
jgi:hypothetical protein